MRHSRCFDAQKKNGGGRETGRVIMFNKKLLILSSAAIVLAVVYVLTFVFDAGAKDARNAAYRWLSPEQAARVTEIELRGADDVTLRKDGETWMVVYPVGDRPEGQVSVPDTEGQVSTGAGLNGDRSEGQVSTGTDLDGRAPKLFPAKEARVKDLLAALTKTGAYSERGHSPSLHEKLDVQDSQPKRILVRDAVGAQLLGLIIGAADAAGGGINLRKAGDDAVRGGEDRFSVFTSSQRSGWAELRLFYHKAKMPVPADVQRLRLELPPEDPAATSPASYSFVRDGKGWKAEGETGSSLDTEKVESYLGALLEAVGENFVPELDAEWLVGNGGVAALVAAKIELEFGDGTSAALYLGPEIEGKYAVVSRQGRTSNHVYLLSGWLKERLFPKDISGFATEK
jgi:hypothetical protein